MEQHERLWELMAKRTAGTLSAAEEVELEVLLEATPEVARQQELLDKISLQSTGKSSLERKELLLDRIMGDIANGDNNPVEETITPERSRSWRAIAAVSLVLVIGAAMAIYLRTTPPAVVWSTVQTKPGSKTRITLPDGSLVVLNAGSTLSYPSNFAKSGRVVKLTGEGYFDVTKMVNDPFVIHTTTVDVKVLGTTFNVRAYADEPHTETALISGAVEVTVKDAGKQHITLSPRQKLVVANAITETAVKQLPAARPDDQKPLIVLENLEKEQGTDLVAEAAWVENRFVYRNENFSQLIIRMERWYGVTVECHNQALLQTSFTGNVQGESLDQLLSMLKQTKQFDYNITAGKVIIH
ncbi:FecR family protein [Chitinophaga qingshengii]|uniref:FecR domain-containing protein n=1 Tax=Chitinophaga qingshengii TaxID=1569794 RepID=A0ABR7TTB7_9BACT|nr:FecR family protein [Chitinophaga qingshengii]MBC9932654.1 FecR domain-containing protein [Chitinophaga qingshengii]